MRVAVYDVATPFGWIPIRGRAPLSVILDPCTVQLGRNQWVTAAGVIRRRWVLRGSGVRG